MRQTVELRLSPQDAADPQRVRAAALLAAHRPDSPSTQVVLRRRSTDARSRQVLIALSVDLYIDETPPTQTSERSRLQAAVASSAQVLIVGAGPAGYFAALECLRYGIRPIVIDRGKDVRARRRDLRAIQQEGHVDSNSNYCFGEGGAGAYSDGKLYTRSSKRGDITRVLRTLVEHGAKSDILIDAHPHIGSNKLPNVVASIRQTILDFGGQVHFESRCTDFLLEKQRCIGAVVNDREEIRAAAVILATGHSARDIYDLCRRRGIRTEFKPFAMGLRAEHPQELIDEIQYRQRPRDVLLEAASYKLVEQVDNRGVYSFCMCPGGLIVPSATAPGEIVVNGMSMSRRDSRFANSGIVVEIRADDVQAYASHGSFAGLAMQQEVEHLMFSCTNARTQRSPGQKLVDFCEGKTSAVLPQFSYIPGMESHDLHRLLPTFIAARLQRAFRLFDKKMRGYYSSEAVVTAVESRTSTPVNIPRDPESLQHVEIAGLYPCGEGAGYAGGIVSAAMDGQRVAQACALSMGCHESMEIHASH